MIEIGDIKSLKKEIIICVDSRIQMNNVSNIKSLKMNDLDINFIGRRCIF